MSWRSVFIFSQPAIPSPHSAATARREGLFLILHLVDMFGVEALQEFRSLHKIELRIPRLDAQKEFVGRRLSKSLHVKHWMIWLRQLVQREHTDDRKYRSAQHGQLERHRDKRRPAVQRSAANIHWIGNRRHPI